MKNELTNEQIDAVLLSSGVGSKTSGEFTREEIASIITASVLIGRATVENEKTLENLRPDSKRYQWLRRHDLKYLSIKYVEGTKHDGEYCVDAGDGLFYGKTFDEAVDAAINGARK